ncbi:MAG: GNAT family N-acetyltransferase [Lachnospiraceae bacterium]|nr:GNAT family N-acetyltransferase [Lachnospiraceae bacterium]
MQFIWTDGNNEDFRHFYIETENYYSSLVGGLSNRKSFVPYNISESITDVVITYIDDKAVACGGLKKYSDTDMEIKRVWVEPDFREKHIATEIMNLLEKRASEMGYKRTILQTREIMTEAVSLYRKRGYVKIKNYPPYDKLDGAVCYAKKLY